MSTCGRRRNKFGFAELFCAIALGVQQLRGCRRLRAGSIGIAANFPDVAVSRSPTSLLVASAPGQKRGHSSVACTSLKDAWPCGLLNFVDGLAHVNVVSVVLSACSRAQCISPTDRLSHHEGLPLRCRRVPRSQIQGCMPTTSAWSGTAVTPLARLAPLLGFPLSRAFRRPPCTLRFGFRRHVLPRLAPGAGFRRCSLLLLQPVVLLALAHMPAVLVGQLKVSIDGRRADRARLRLTLSSAASHAVFSFSLLSFLPLCNCQCFRGCLARVSATLPSPLPVQCGVRYRLAVHCARSLRSWSLLWGHSFSWRPLDRHPEGVLLFLST